MTDATGLLDLIDRLETLLNESELSEIEIEAGGTALVLRKPVAFAPAVQSSVAGPESAGSNAPAAVSGGGVTDDGPSPNAVLAPLTGLYYRSPSPGAEPYVREGSPVVEGQVIGLIEAMKLFNELKSDRSGRVTRIYPESGALVKAKQPLIEVEP